jgi:UDPglucose--hexose-1-phosphate uridylyltransferase
LPELRLDPLSGLRTIVAGERAGRPGGEFSVKPRPAIDPESDPFLEGHEDRTPPELYALRPNGGAPDSPGWLVRVVPNLYPALGDEAADGSPPADPLAEGRGQPNLFSARQGRGQPNLFSARPAVGAHEVIVHTPQPLGSLAELDVEQLEAAMGVWGERMRAHGEEAEYMHLIVNEGREAGASLPHTHAQLYALGFVPAAIARERERFTAWYERTQGRNLLEDLLQEEVRLRERVVAVDAEAVVLSPYAARVPFQLQIVPRRPRARFEDEGPLGAAMLLDALRRLESVLGGLPPFNLWVRTAPRGATSFCWRIDLLPRLAQLAGLELGAGLNLNIVPPEVAAERLRGVSV